MKQLKIFILLFIHLCRSFDLQIFFSKVKIPAKALIFFLLFSQTACFEVLEEIDLQTQEKNPNGKYQLTLNLSQSKNKLVTLMALDSINGLQIPKKEKIIAELNRLQNILSQQKGISNVQIKEDFEQFVFVLRFDFANLIALEKAVLITIRNLNPNPDWTPPTENLLLEGKTLKRRGDYGFGKNLEKIKPENRQYLQQAQYTSVVRLQSLVSKTNKPDLKISKSGKSIFLKYNLWQIVSAEKNIGFEILLQ